MALLLETQNGDVDVEEETNTSLPKIFPRAAEPVETPSGGSCHTPSLALVGFPTLAVIPIKGEKGRQVTLVPRIEGSHLLLPTNPIPPYPGPYPCT